LNELAMQDVYRVRPHVFRRPINEEYECVGLAEVDGKPVLVVPISEEIAEEVRWAFEGLDPAPVSAEEIELICLNHNLALVGFVGFDPPEGDNPPPLSVVSVEVVGMVLEEGGD
jgi:hypothetical protein